MSKFGNTLRDTQEHLIKLLGLDYETLRCTSFFEQGDSNAFSKLSPKDSKLVVMKILQLDVYEKYEKIAREKYNVLLEEGRKLQAEIAAITSIESTPLISTLLQEQELKILDSHIIALNKQIEEMQQKAIIANKINELGEFAKGIDELEKCPTCLQKVTKVHKGKISKQIDKQINELIVSIEGINPLITLGNLRSELSAGMMRKGNLQRELTEINRKNAQSLRVSEDISQKTKDLEGIKSQLEVMKDLVVTFGRNGIPSFIIENVVPEIEQIVNDLLEELDLNIRIMLELQKELKTGGLSDTLDIWIISSQEKRQYYNYSGGEKFLIDFALRIALSVLLLRRKGSKVSTLLLDEGMGSLDEVNRDKLTQLINIVKNKYEFKKILIISHIAEIQDAFENKIFISKNKEGISEVRYNKIEEEQA